MWADFSLKDLGEPFRMWYIFADFSKKQTKELERLLRLFRRSRNRKKTHSILKAWKHLVSAAMFIFWGGAAVLSSWLVSGKPSAPSGSKFLCSTEISHGREVREKVGDVHVEPFGFSGLLQGIPWYIVEFVWYGL